MFKYYIFYFPAHAFNTCIPHKTVQHVIFSNNLLNINPNRSRHQIHKFKSQPQQASKLIKSYVKFHILNLKTHKHH